MQKLEEEVSIMRMMGTMKGKNSLLSPRSLVIHAIGIGAAVWLGKTWGEKTEDY